MSKGKILEEDLFYLTSFLVYTGAFGSWEHGTSAVLTNYRLSYQLNGRLENIYLSSIKKIHLTKKIFRRAEHVRLECLDGVINVSCDNLNAFYLKLQEAIEINDQCAILNRSQTIGGVSRILGRQLDHDNELCTFGHSAFSDLTKLKSKSKKLLDVLSELKDDKAGKGGSVQDLFGKLNIHNVFSEQFDTKEVEDILNLLLMKNDFVLLMDLFCAVNRALLCDFISPKELYNLVTELQKQNKLKLQMVHGVVGIFKPNGTFEKDYIISKFNKVPIDLFEFAKKCGISIILAQYKLHHALSQGWIVLDNSTMGVYYYTNNFLK